ncbi:MAG: hypothetical protein GY950_25365 [bacterium]|nr:hypothetical protein [bacterium]
MRTDRFTLLIAVLASILVVGIACSTGPGDDMTKITAGDAYPGDMGMNAFTLNKDCTIKVEGTLGLFHERGRELVFYGWILDSATRKPVWNMLTHKGDFDKGLNVLEESISLPKGDYEIYYVSELNSSQRVGDYPGILSRVIGGVLGSKSDWDAPAFDENEDLKLTVYGAAGDIVQADLLKMVKARKESAVLSLTGVGDRSRVNKIFALSGETTLRIYAVGEGNRRAVLDYAWIDELSTHKRVWTMGGRNAKPAGGGRKNLLTDHEITLPAGTYLVQYATDDSHSYEEWNTLPPVDPRFWGVTIWAASEKDRANIKILDNFKAPEPLLELTRVKDSESLSRAIRVKKPLDVRVLCVGEADGRNSYDHGWIVNAATGKNVWAFKGKRTVHAGGAAKNRMINEIVRLGRGNYIVHYVTDGSHSFQRWNDKAPSEPDRWGLTLWLADEKDRKYIEIKG